VRCPASESELPGLTWLAYGSSITNSDARGYPHQAARLLGVDVMNMGLSGACHMEPEMIDYLCDLDFDFATCELGVNMRGNFDRNEFERRASYLFDTFERRHGGKPLGIITPFPNFDHFSPKESVTQKRQNEFSEILRDLVKASGNPGIFLIEGEEVLSRFTGLRIDLLHPSEFGQIHMGIELAKILAPRIESL